MGTKVTEVGDPWEWILYEYLPGTKVLLRRGVDEWLIVTRALWDETQASRFEHEQRNPKMKMN